MTVAAPSPITVIVRLPLAWPGISVDAATRPAMGERSVAASRVLRAVARFCWACSRAVWSDATLAGPLRWVPPPDEPEDDPLAAPVDAERAADDAAEDDPADDPAPDAVAPEAAVRAPTEAEGAEPEEEPVGRAVTAAPDPFVELEGAPAVASASARSARQPATWVASGRPAPEADVAAPVVDQVWAIEPVVAWAVA